MRAGDHIRVALGQNCNRVAERGQADDFVVNGLVILGRIRVRLVRLAEEQVLAFESNHHAVRHRDDALHVDRGREPSRRRDDLSEVSSRDSVGDAAVDLNLSKLDLAYKLVLRADGSCIGAVDANTVNVPGPYRSKVKAGQRDSVPVQRRN